MLCLGGKNKRLAQNLKPSKLQAKWAMMEIFLPVEMKFLPGETKSLTSCVKNANSQLNLTEYPSQMCQQLTHSEL